MPEAVTRALDDPANESPKPGDKAFDGATFTLAARPADALAAAEAAARAAGYAVVSLGDRVEGEAREVAAAHAQMARELRAAGKRAVIMSGGELTVTIRGQGRGGPNQEYALALAIGLAGMTGIAGIAGDTDGTDGGAGSATDPGRRHHRRRHRRAGEKAAVSILPPFSPTTIPPDSSRGSAICSQPGPTYTNVNDFRAIVVDTP